jgi:hypothetical protein
MNRQEKRHWGAGKRGTSPRVRAPTVTWACGSQARQDVARAAISAMVSTNHPRHAPNRKQKVRATPKSPGAHSIARPLGAMMADYDIRSMRASVPNISTVSSEKWSPTMTKKTPSTLLAVLDTLAGGNVVYSDAAKACGVGVNANPCFHSKGGVHGGSKMSKEKWAVVRNKDNAICIFHVCEARTFKRRKLLNSIPSRC